MQFPIPDAALLQHTAILGKTGAGKTTTAKAIVEHVVGHNMRVCVLDPIKSDWWGLTSSKDGKHAGLPFVILGGPHGHVPLHATSGKAIGELVARGKDLPLSILDMADFGPGGQQRFFIDFASTLLKRMQGVLYLVMEEAHLFAPKERSGVGDENMAIHWAKMLATAGRSKGLRLVLATQRTQALHNALLGSCDTMIALRMTAPADQGPVRKWLKANVLKETAQEVENSLSGLKTGSAWVCAEGMANLVPFPPIKTYDNTATPTQDSAPIEVKQAAVDMEHLKTVVGDAVKESAGNNPKMLKAEIARLESEMQKLTAQKSDDYRLTDVEIEVCKKEGYDKGWGDAVKHMGEKGTEARLKVCKAIELLTAADTVDLNGLIIPPVKTEVNYAKPMHAPIAQLAERLVSTQKAAGSTPAGRSNGHLEAPLQKIIDAIMWWNVLGVEEPNHPQVGFIAGYSHKSGTWATYLSRLRSQGLIAPKGILELTDAGSKQAALPRETPDPAAFRDTVLMKIDGPLRRIMEPLLHAYPGALSSQLAGERAGYSHTSGTCATYLSRLRSLDLIEPKGPLRAKDWLFP